MPLLAFFLFLLICLHCSPQVASTTGSSFSQSVLSQGSSLLVEKNDHLVSPNQTFTAGFHQVGQNAYYFAIWFSEPTSDAQHILVWMANRDEPVNGKRSKFSLTKTGNLVLTDAGQRSWTSDTTSDMPLQLLLLDSGNLVLTRLDNNDQPYIWQSFSFPTDTILPNQPFTKDTVLISSRSSTNFSSGFYKLYFDNDNVIRLLYDNGEVTSVYWPDPWLRSWEAGRTSYNNSRLASLDSRGRFRSSDDLNFRTSDHGKTLQRRLKLDVDGNIRVYSLNERRWIVSWQAISKTCSIHGICGPNSLCSYSNKLGRRCNCMHGYKVKNNSDLSFGCEPTFDFSEDAERYEFIELPHTEFYGFQPYYTPDSGFQGCKNICLNDV